MNVSSPTERSRGVDVAALIVWAAAVVLSAMAAWSALHLWGQLPNGQISALSADAVERASRELSRSASPEVREAWMLADVGRQFTTALRDESKLDELGTQMGTYAGGMTHTQLGRLMQAAVRMREMEVAGTPTEVWWPVLEPYLSGVVGGSFAHHQRELRDAWAGMYRALGVDVGSAARRARTNVGHRHNPFLQYFVARMGRVAETEEQAGAAETCRTIVRRLLRQWVLEPGSAGLRLLAADLLADVLEADAATIESPHTKALAGNLRAWRAAYRDNAQRRGTDFLGPMSEPAPCPREHNRLFNRLVLTTWTFGGAIAIAILGVLTGWAWVLSGKTERLSLTRAIVPLVVAGLSIVFGVVWLTVAPDAVRDDFRRDWTLSSFETWWRHPLLSAALASALVFAAALISRPPRPERMARLGRTAVLSWLVLAGVGLGCTLSAESARASYEQALQAAEVDLVRTIAGDEADRLLDGLRAWDPGLNSPPTVAP